MGELGVAALIGRAVPGGEARGRLVGELGVAAVELVEDVVGDALEHLPAPIVCVSGG